MSGSPWIVVVVRAWVQGDDRVIRMTLSGANRNNSPVVTYEATSAAAGRRLAFWVDELADSSGAAYDEPADAALTPGGRRDNGDLPNLAEPPGATADLDCPDTSPRHEES